MIIPFRIDKASSLLWKRTSTKCTKCNGTGYLTRKERRKPCYKYKGKGKY